jgi:hypothetical protein
MRLVAIIIGVLGMAASPAPAALIWDNYISQPDGYDHLSTRSSERNTLVADSWTADDFIIDPSQYPGGVQIEQIRWIGMHTKGAAFGTADYIILDGSFSVIAEVSNHSYPADPIGTDFNLDTYEGTVAVQPPAVLPPGHYYVATRLVDSGVGRNYVATTGAGTLAGLTSGAFQSVFFGVPNWTLVSDLPGARVTDFAYRIVGSEVPEPGVVALLAAGIVGLLVQRSRRL